MCTHDLPDSVWGFPYMIHMDILNEFYAVPVYCLRIHVDYNDVTTIHEVQNNLRCSSYRFRWHTSIQCTC